MKPIHVLVLITKMDRAGAETLAMNYMRNVDRNIIKYDFLVNRPEISDYEDEIKSLGGKVYHMGPLYPLKIRQYKKQFRKFLAEHPEYQIIHSHLEERSYYALKIAKDMGIPIRICHGHSHPTHFDIKLPVRYYYKHRVRKYYTHAMACSKEVARWLYGEKALPNVFIMKNAIDTTLFSKDAVKAEEVRKELHLEDKLVIAHVGRFTKVKNQRKVLGVFSQIYRRNHNAVLLLIGGGNSQSEKKYLKKIRERARDLRIESAVRFLGVRSDMHRVMQVVDALVLPSLSEGFPMTLVEAQSMGIRCIVSDAVSWRCNLTGNIEFIPLELRNAVWAARILQFIKQPIETRVHLITQKGHDIKDNAKWLQELYITELDKAIFD